MPWFFGLVRRGSDTAAIAGSQRPFSIAASLSLVSQ
jgi:hypothetical protein